MQPRQMRLIPASQWLKFGRPILSLAQSANQSDKSWPVFGSLLWHGKVLEHVNDLTFRCNLVEDFGCCARPDAWKELQDPKPSDPISWVFAPAQDTHHVFDVRGFEKLEPTIFDKWNIAASELDFELGTVVRCSKQHGLLFQGDPCFPRLKNPPRHIPRLRCLIGHCRQVWLLLRPPFGEQVFRKPVLGKSNDQVGRIQDWLSRPIILFERNDAGSRLKLVGKRTVAARKE